MSVEPTFWYPTPVTIVSDGKGGSHPEPAGSTIDLRNHLELLQWHAGCIKARTGLEILINRQFYLSHDDAYRLCVNYRGPARSGSASLGSEMGFEEAWRTMGYVEEGAQLMWKSMTTSTEDYWKVSNNLPTLDS